MSVKLAPVHPGEILREEFLLPMGLSVATVARAVGVPRTRIERLVQETDDLTSGTALLLASFFGTSPQFWLNLQSRYAMDQSEP